MKPAVRDSIGELDAIMFPLQGVHIPALSWQENPYHERKSTDKGYSSHAGFKRRPFTHHERYVGGR